MLNQSNIDTHSFTNKSSMRPILQCINYTPTHTIATDSYKLIKVENSKEELENFPVQNGKEQVNDLPCLIPASLLKQVKLPKKSPLPILKSACTHVEDGRVSLNSTDLETWNNPEAYITSGQFPNTDVVMPSEELINDSPTVRIGAEHLLELAKWAKKHALNGSIDITLLNQSTASTQSLKPLYFKGITNDNQKFEGLIMPLNK